MIVSLSDACMLTSPRSSLGKVLMDYAMDNTSRLSHRSSILIYLLGPDLTQVSPSPEETGEKVTAVRYDNQGFPSRGGGGAIN